MRVVQLDDNNTGAYHSFLGKLRHSTVYVSNPFRLLLRDYTGGKDHYFLAVDDDGAIKAAFPLFLSGDHRPVANSLPFFGSYGGVLGAAEDAEARELLMHRVLDFCRQADCITATVITSPFDEDQQFYFDRLAPAYRDDRISQVTYLPTHWDDLDEKLMCSYDSSARRNVRKAIKSGVSVSEDMEGGYWDFLRLHHQEGMRAIGSSYKEEPFFNLVPRYFQAGQDYSLYVAHHGGEPIAALLVLYFNQIAEYFVPVTVASHRGLQPMALLLHHAMREAAQNGFRVFNWGGTLKTMQGVYRFKAKWGAIDKPYYYFTVGLAGHRDLFGWNPQRILNQYPNYYVLPFSLLEG